MQVDHHTLMECSMPNAPMRHPGLRSHGPAGAGQVCLPRARIQAADDKPPVVAAACPVARIEVTHVPVQAFCHTAPPIHSG